MLKKISGQEMAIVITAVVVLLFVYSSILFQESHDTFEPTMTFEDAEGHGTVMNKHEFEELLKEERSQLSRYETIAYRKN